MARNGRLLLKALNRGHHKFCHPLSKDMNQRCRWIGTVLQSYTHGVACGQRRGALGDKNRKERLTCLMIVIQSGTKKEIITIGKFPNPRRFRNKAPPLKYYSNKEAWMTSEIWETIVTNFNSKMQRNGHNVLLFCDNASCHKLNYELSNTKIIFMPCNITSLIPPPDQGIIRTVKVYYRTQLIRQMVIAMDNGVKPDHFARSICVLKALYMLKRAFFLLTPSIIYKCFRKTGFVLHVLRQEQREIEEINIPEADPPEEFTAQEFNEFVDIDSGEQCSGVMTDQEIKYPAKFYLPMMVKRNPKLKSMLKKPLPHDRMRWKCYIAYGSCAQLSRTKTKFWKKLTTVHGIAIIHFQFSHLFLGMSAENMGSPFSCTVPKCFNLIFQMWIYFLAEKCSGKWPLRRLLFYLLSYIFKSTSHSPENFLKAGTIHFLTLSRKA